jgi:hypothetical protein
MEDKLDALRSRYLVIVSRDHPGLVPYLLQDFAHLKVAEVALDRRQRERRHRAWTRDPNRRCVDRRQDFSGGSILRRHGFAIFQRKEVGLTTGRMN